jgi:hypothetical protein
MKDNLTYKKSEVKWISEGDANSRFFYLCLNMRRNSNSIIALRDGQVWVEQVTGIKELVNRHFMKQFNEEMVTRPNLDMEWSSKAS